MDLALQRELAYHEELYGGFAQSHFARPAVRALRAHMVSRLLKLERRGRVLSLGCGIGDTELLLAPHVRELVGVDLSPAAIGQARADAAAAGLANTRFLQGTMEEAPEGPYDLVFAIFFLHHLPDAALARAPALIARLLAPGGVFYSLDPSRYRLSGAVGNLLIPKLMRKYQSPDEHELRPGPTRDLFRQAGFECSARCYDFISSPLAGLFPGWAAGYHLARFLDDGLVALPGICLLGSNFELIARRDYHPQNVRRS